MEMSRSKADAIANGVFLISLAFLYYFNWWWPGILISLWLTFAIRQLISHRYQDFFLTTLLLLSLFIVAYFQLSWDLLLPILFVLAGGFIIFREFVSSDSDENPLPK